MALVVFPPAMQRHVAAPPVTAAGGTVREVLDNAFGERAAVRSYVLEDDGGLRKHMALFVDGVQIRDRSGLSDPVRPDSRVEILQALSGG